MKRWWYYMYTNSTLPFLAILEGEATELKWPLLNFRISVAAVRYPAIFGSQQSKHLEYSGSHQHSMSGKTENSPLCSPLKSQNARYTLQLFHFLGRIQKLGIYSHSLCTELGEGRGEWVHASSNHMLYSSGPQPGIFSTQTEIRHNRNQSLTNVLKSLNIRHRF